MILTMAYFSVLVLFVASFIVRLLIAIRDNNTY